MKKTFVFIKDYMKITNLSLKILEELIERKQTYLIQSMDYNRYILEEIDNANILEEIE